MNRLLLCTLLLTTSFCTAQMDFSTIVSKIEKKNIECGVGVIISVVLLKHNNTASQVLGALLGISTLGLYASDYTGVSDACKKIRAALG